MLKQPRSQAPAQLLLLAKHGVALGMRLTFTKFRYAMNVFSKQADAEGWNDTIPPTLLLVLTARYLSLLQSIPKRARKVKIDARFRSMFSDRRFKVKCMKHLRPPFLSTVFL